MSEIAAEYTFHPMVGIDQNGVLLRGGVGQLYDVGDASFSTPLTAKSPDGNLLLNITISDIGLTQTFKLDRPEVVWKSGSFIVPLFAFTSVLEQMRLILNSAQTIGASAAGSAAAALAAQAAAQQLRDSITGLPDLPELGFGQIWAGSETGGVIAVDMPTGGPDGGLTEQQVATLIAQATIAATNVSLATAPAAGIDNVEQAITSLWARPTGGPNTGVPGVLFYLWSETANAWNINPDLAPSGTWLRVFINGSAPVAEKAGVFDLFLVQRPA